jgi:hypothetical protein
MASFAHSSEALKTGKRAIENDIERWARPYRCPSARDGIATFAATEFEGFDRVAMRRQRLSDLDIPDNSDYLH